MSVARIPTGSHPATRSAESTTSGAAQPRPHEESFGHSVLSMVGDLAGTPALSPQHREHAAAAIDSGLALLFRQVQESTKAGNASSFVRVVLGSLIALAFVVVGMMLWTLFADLRDVSERVTTNQAIISNEREDAIAERKEQRHNIRVISGFLLSLTDEVNKGGVANYQLLRAIGEAQGVELPDVDEPTKIGKPWQLEQLAE